MALHRVLVGEAEIPLTDTDMSDFLKEPIHIVRDYYQLQGKGVEWLLGSSRKYILLYDFPGEDVGHWVCGWLDDSNTLHHFDPYGNPPDFYTDMTIYSDVFNSYPSTATNSVQFQVQRNKVQTCGRHCLVRLLFSYLGEGQYNDLMRGKANGPDNLVTLMTIVTTLHNSVHAVAAGGRAILLHHLAK